MKIVSLDRLTWNSKDEEIFKELYNLGDTNIYKTTPEELKLERSIEADILLVNESSISEDLINKLPNLKYIGIRATGLNNVDVKAALGKGIVVTNVPAYATESVGQMAISLLLQLASDVSFYSNEVKKGNWGKTSEQCFKTYPVVELYGKTMGIIGYGKIGRNVGQIASALGMKIVVSNGVSKTIENPLISMEELFKTSDVICLCCPLVKETEGLINSKTLSLMKPSSYIINVSRGKLVVESHLAAALNSGEIAGYGADVLYNEPPEETNPLLTSKNTIITPHISTATAASRERLAHIMVDNIKAFINGKPLNRVTL